jgi:hypothetical protein
MYSYNNVLYYTSLNTNYNDEHSGYVNVLYKDDVIAHSAYFVEYDYNKCNNYIKQQIIKNNPNDINTININHKCIAVTQWWKSYGHLLDSLTVLHEYYEIYSYKSKGYKVILNIPFNEVKIIEIAEILFGDDFINLYNYDMNYNYIRFDTIDLFNNHCNTPSFLKFPDISSNKIIEKINDSSLNSCENVFMTRSFIPLHRILDNHNELELFFKNKGFNIINPEIISNKELYNTIKHAKNIIITNGSALTNLIFINKNTKIFCLNSASYLPEWRRSCKTEHDIDHNLWAINNFEKNIWKNKVSQYNFTYVDSFLNKISNEQCEVILSSLQ